MLDMRHKTPYRMDDLKAWYDNHFGKPLEELNDQEIKCLTETYSFSLFVAGRRLQELKKEIGRIFIRDRQN
jgi:hypothetical protein